MAKGTFGETLRIVISLVLAITALILIWYFHDKITAFFGGLLLEGMKNFFCSLLYWLPGFVCG
ncbi:MAG: hypothetical protein HYS62_01180 [Candidatus Aenigmarchaeota archaeon]|nr:hypothetical protein [Candidatus Aenigmarchaeota archaeon]